MRHLRSVSYGFVGILYSRRLILLYSNHLEGRQTAENHHVHIGTRRMHVMTSSISIFSRFLFSRKQVCPRKFAPSENFPLYGITIATAQPTITVVSEPHVYLHSCCRRGIHSSFAIFFLADFHQTFLFLQEQQQSNNVYKHCFIPHLPLQMSFQWFLQVIESFVGGPWKGWKTHTRVSPW